MSLLKAKNLIQEHDLITYQLLLNLKAMIGIKFKYKDNVVEIIEANYLELIVVEFETVNKVKFKEFLTFSEFKYYIDKLEEL